MNFELNFSLGIIFVNSDKNHLINFDKKRYKINKMWTKESKKKKLPITKSEPEKSKMFLPKHHPVAQENSKLILRNSGLNIAIG